jgi:hypothetical protein
MNEFEQITSTHALYKRNRPRWMFLLQSYIGGESYRQGAHLTRYAYETQKDYEDRLLSTPLDNHCRGVIDTYNAFLFRQNADRDYGSLGGDPGLEPFLEDADLEGRTLHQFMKDVATYASVFGHTWVLISKPQTNALTRADELSQGVRPYVSQISPLNVIDWTWQRATNGYYELSYLKYYEDNEGRETDIVKEWTKDTITTWFVDSEKNEVKSNIIEPNGLNKIPAVIVYANRGTTRSVGVSDISDIADLQKMIYNNNSEIEQGIRLSSHPSLVKTPDVEATAGAGAIIQMPDNLDPGLKPYLLENSGSNLTQIFASSQILIDAIDRIANTASVRAITERTLSGIAMATEFRQLEAKLGERAHNLEFAEEQIWRLWALYQGRVWDGEIKYPDSFTIQDKDGEFRRLQMAKSTATDPLLFKVIDGELLELMGKEKEMLPYDDINPIPGRTYPDGEAIPESLPPAYKDSAEPDVPEGQNCANCEYYKSSEGYCIKFDANVRPLFWCAKWEPKDL